MKRTLTYLLLTTLMSVASVAQSLIEGRLTTTDPKGEPAAYATVYAVGTTYGTATDGEGRYRMEVPAGSYMLRVSLIGYGTVECHVLATDGSTTRCDVTLSPHTTELETVEVTATGVERVMRTPYNVVAIDTEEMANSTKNLSDALAKMPGMKLRESGGVGSDMQLMMDGFTGKHIKIFIDGVPQEGAGTAFNLNNIPVSYAKRVEVYKGVVPVEFGGDALAGVVNIVTDKQPRRWALDAAYSYGSFGTHKSHLHFGRSHANGFTYELKAYQNYSDNDYYVHNYVRQFTVKDDGTIRWLPTDKSDVRRVKRFNDRFHNESVAASVGLTGRPWADRLMLTLTAANFYKEIQTGVYQEMVFGDKHRHGYSVVPSAEYRKNNIIDRLDVAATANYNHNVTHNVDTTSMGYTWAGLSYDRGSKGEQSYQLSKSQNSNFNATLNAKYRLGEAHTFTLNHVYSTYSRTSRRSEGAETVLTAFDIPKLTQKNVSGLSYRLMPSERWNVTVFGKHYHQYNQGPVSTSADGVGNYVNLSKRVSSWGYGTAGTWIAAKGLQAKLSYEKACRLPSTDELFGDEDMEAGKMDLRPERSDNLNLNLSYGTSYRRHGIYAEVALIYRDTKDYIKRGIGKHGAIAYGMYENHGHVKTMGYNASVRYSYGEWIDVGGTYNSIDTRDNERYLAGGTLQENLHYGVRLPNIPYRYFNADATLSYPSLITKGDRMSLTYDLFWQHEFPLYWENMGDASTKHTVPTQAAHNVVLTYSVRGGRYNLSVECRNLTDARLYDNFSLQKAGRAYYAKVRINLGK